MGKRERIAYFCMEYGLDSSLPLYAGGLGVLAGDYLKAAKQQEAPIVGIGIRWWQDYTQQLIDKKTNKPYDVFPTHNLDFLQDTGIKININIEDKNVESKIYKVSNFNNVPLYLLDTGHPESEFGWITDRLYGGDDNDRIAQEILLGIGGIKALRALGIEVDKYHFNEGHAGFGGLELIREKISNTGLSFTEALTEVKKKIIFTTHTPVPAGNEAHNIGALMKIGANNGFSREQLIKIGGDPFNMTAACLHMSSIANGVSKLHGQTAREMWKDLDDRAPIISITNGIHINTWQNKKIKEAFEKRKNIWSRHMELKRELVDFVKEKNGASMNPHNLIIGFARRAAPYKRSELIFRGTEQINDFLHNGRLQLIFSGKAHPDDNYGKNIVATLVKMDKKYEDSVVFLENYNMKIAKYLTQGCDIWLNNPKRPLEASGTSGMKAAVNGVLNLSVMDGWVAEGLEHGITGWLLDELFSEFNDSLGEDEKDLRALYQIIKENVIPIYYQDHEKWTNMMYASIEMALNNFSASSMLNQYYEKMYSKKAKHAEPAPF